MSDKQEQRAIERLKGYEDPIDCISDLLDEVDKYREESRCLREVRARVKDIEDDTGRFEAIVVIGEKRICPVPFVEWGEAIAENINDALGNNKGANNDTADD